MWGTSGRGQEVNNTFFEPTACSKVLKYTGLLFVPMMSQRCVAVACGTATNGGRDIGCHLIVAWCIAFNDVYPTRSSVVVKCSDGYG